jgi:Cu/Ag efflux pump CusA
MIARILSLSAKYRGFVFLLYAVLVIGSCAAAKRVQLDAIPDLSDPQVIVFTEWKGRSPTLVEDQVTYPIASALLAARARFGAIRCSECPLSTCSSTKAPTSTGRVPACSNI